MALPLLQALEMAEGDNYKEAAGREAQAADLSTPVRDPEEPLASDWPSSGRCSHLESEPAGGRSVSLSISVSVSISHLSPIIYLSLPFSVTSIFM